MRSDQDGQPTDRIPPSYVTDVNADAFWARVFVIVGLNHEIEVYVRTVVSANTDDWNPASGPGLDRLPLCPH